MPYDEELGDTWLLHLDTKLKAQGDADDAFGGGTDSTHGGEQQHDDEEEEEEDEEQDDEQDEDEEWAGD
jgi:hypothetical protein